MGLPHLFRARAEIEYAESAYARALRVTLPHLNPQQCPAFSTERGFIRRPGPGPGEGRVRMIIGPGLRPPEAQTALHTTSLGSSGDWIVAELAGEIDSAAEATVGRMLVDAVGPGRADLVVDLSAVRFLDSSGFRALLRARDRVAGLAGRLRIVCPEGAVHARLMVLMCADGPPVFPDLGSATGGGPG
jgi:anti-anti-sigma factor